MDPLERDFGRLEARVSALEDDMAELKADTKQILATLSEAKGGWKTLLLVAGAAGTCGAFVGKFFPFLK